MEIAKKKIAYNGIGLPIDERIEEVYTIDTPDYWTRLEHQYAGMAMQAMLANPEVLQTVTSAKELLAKDYAEKVAIVADRYATALVEKLKEKEGR